MLLELLAADGVPPPWAAPLYRWSRRGRLLNAMTYLYNVRITLTTRGIRPERHSSAYEVWCCDGRLVDSCDHINNDPEGHWAIAEASGKAKNDAAARGLVLEDAAIGWHVSEVREDSRGRRQ